MTPPTDTRPRRTDDADARTHDGDDDPRDASRRARREWPLVLLLAACLVSAAGIVRWLDAQRPAPSPAASLSEELYVSPQAARRLSLGFNGLAADWYWLRTLQYVGRKVTAHKGQIQIDDLGALELRALAPLLDHATTLDPQFMAAYEYGAVVLPAVDVGSAVKLINKGIEANPRAWRLRSHLGYIHWQAGRYAEASEAYRAAAAVPGAPGWLGAMAAQMSAKGGSRDTSRAIYETMLRTTDDDQMKRLALRRLAQLQSLDEQDALRRLLAAHRERAGGHCASSWRELAPLLRATRLKLDASGAPVDPSGVPYRLSDKCEVELGEGSEILRSY